MDPLRVDLHQKTAVITGAGTGIGRATALGMVRCGVRVVASYCRSQSETEQLVDQIIESGSEAFPVRADVTKWDDTQSLFRSAVDAFGRVDILVENAGGNIQKTMIVNMDEQVWD